MHPEPNFGKLLDWLEQRLPADEAARIDALVANGNSRLRNQVDWLRAYLAAAKHVQFASSPALRERLMRMFERHMNENRPQSVFRRYLAALVGDSRQQLGALGGMRGDASVGPRQMLYAAEVADVVVNLVQEGGQNHIHGQVFADDSSGVIVQLLRNDVEAGMTFASETGHFVFANVAPGRYAIVVAADDYEVLVDAVPIEG